MSRSRSSMLAARPAPRLGAVGAVRSSWSARRHSAAGRPIPARTGRDTGRDEDEAR